MRERSGADITRGAELRTAAGKASLTLAEALIMASRAPAQFLRRGQDLGRLAPGYLASLVHLDENLRVRETWVEET